MAVKKYLLSNCTSTTDPARYIQDLLKVHLYLRPNDIPYWVGGSKDIIKSYTESELATEVGVIVENVIDNINQATGAGIELISLKVTSDAINLELNFNNKTVPYVIKRSN